MRLHCPHCETVSTLDLQSDVETCVCPNCGQALVDDDTYSETVDLPASPKQLAHFQLLEVVGRGGFGVVWKARDLNLDRIVAVKVAHRRRSQLGTEFEPFLREARAAAKLSHPNLVTVFEVGKADEQVFIVSDFIDGATLQEWFALKQFTQRKGIKLCAKIARAVHCAHGSGLIHRDLKPSNILINLEGEPFVTDFGIAKNTQSETTRSLDNCIVGTPAYMPPEQAKGDSNRVTAQADVYSLGVILFELRTGELPFRGDYKMLLIKILVEEPESPRRYNSEVTKDLETICLKCLEKDPKKRFTSADELERTLAGEPIQSRSISVAERLWRRYTRDPRAPSMVAGGYCFLIGLIFTTWSVFGLLQWFLIRESLQAPYQILGELLGLLVVVYLPTMIAGIQVLNGRSWLIWPLAVAFGMGAVVTGVSALILNTWLNVLETVNQDVNGEGAKYPQIQLFSLMAVQLLIGTLLHGLALIEKLQRAKLNQ